jgi:DNA-binding NarL/FixJ family response regulator
VLVVGNDAGKTKLALKLEPNMEVVVTSDSSVFDVAGSSRNVAVIVIDIDDQGVAMVHNLHTLFPAIRIVAVTAHASKAEQAKAGGASAVVISDAPSAIVQAVVETIVANKS